MRTFATLKNFKSPVGKQVISRNLNRILGIVILDLDIENSTITFLHTSNTTLESVKRELRSLGFPIVQFQIQKKSSIDVTRTLV